MPWSISAPPRCRSRIKVYFQLCVGEFSLSPLSERAISFRILLAFDSASIDLTATQIWTDNSFSPAELKQARKVKKLFHLIVPTNTKMKWSGTWSIQQLNSMRANSSSSPLRAMGFSFNAEVKRVLARDIVHWIFRPSISWSPSLFLSDNLK